MKVTNSAPLTFTPYQITIETKEESDILEAILSWNVSIPDLFPESVTDSTHGPTKSQVFDFISVLSSIIESR